MTKSISMFNTKNKSDMQNEKSSGNGTTLVGAGTTVKGDVNSNSDLRIDGTITGNIFCSAKIIVGANGVVEGDVSGNQADIVGKVAGNIRAKDLLQLRADSIVTGNIYAGRLQIEPSATFNGQCHMGANVVEMNNNEQQAAAQ
jgi:cytoskeletal protein CcmA (bactofilin family)